MKYNSNNNLPSICNCPHSREFSSVRFWYTLPYGPVTTTPWSRLHNFLAHHMMNNQAIVFVVSCITYHLSGPPYVQRNVNIPSWYPLVSILYATRVTLKMESDHDEQGWAHRCIWLVRSHYWIHLPRWNKQLGSVWLLQCFSFNPFPIRLPLDLLSDSGVWKCPCMVFT